MDRHIPNPLPLPPKPMLSIPFFSPPFSPHLTYLSTHLSSFLCSLCVLNGHLAFVCSSFVCEKFTGLKLSVEKLHLSFEKKFMDAVQQVLRFHFVCLHTVRKPQRTETFRCSNWVILFHLIGIKTYINCITSFGNLIKQMKKEKNNGHYLIGLIVAYYVSIQFYHFVRLSSSTRLLLTAICLSKTYCIYLLRLSLSITCSTRVCVCVY